MSQTLWGRPCSCYDGKQCDCGLCEEMVTMEDREDDAKGARDAIAYVFCGVVLLLCLMLGWHLSLRLTA